MIVGNDFITIVRETFSASVLVTAVVLKYSPRFMVVPVDRSALNPSLAAVPTCRVMNVNFPPLGFIPVAKSDVAVSVALNVAGLRCYVLRFYSIFLVICFSTGVPW